MIPEPLDTRSFRCAVERDGNVVRVRTIGELDLNTVPVLAAEIEDQREAGCSRMIIDLRGLTFLDCSGLRLLLDCYAESRQDGFTVAMVAAPPTVQRLFHTTRTTEYLPFISG